MISKRGTRSFSKDMPCDSQSKRAIRIRTRLNPNSRACNCMKKVLNPLKSNLTLYLIDRSVKK